MIAGSLRIATGPACTATILALASHVARVGLALLIGLDGRLPRRLCGFVDLLLPAVIAKQPKAKQSPEGMASGLHRLVTDQPASVFDIGWPDAVNFDPDDLSSI